MDQDYKERECSEWSLYDSNVQTYRSNMIASQSLLLAVAAIFYGKNNILVITVCLIGLFIQWYIWYRVISRRAIISDYHKFNFQHEMSLKINDEGGFWKEGDRHLSEQTYVANRGVRKKVNTWLADETGNPKYKHNMRITRFKLDVIIPILFSVLWALILVFSIMGGGSV